MAEVLVTHLISLKFFAYVDSKVWKLSTIVLNQCVESIYRHIVSQCKRKMFSIILFAKQFQTEHRDV